MSDTKKGVLLLMQIDPRKGVYNQVAKSEPDELNVIKNKFDQIAAEYGQEMTLPKGQYWNYKVVMLVGEKQEKKVFCDERPGFFVGK